ncbi:MAG TPA: DUF6029 family protein, partial [Polyangia bacterium]|nr:DUF6029 family protein [Polyangia bacterium]
MRQGTHESGSIAALALAAGLFALLDAGSARGQEAGPPPVTFSGTETLITEYVGDNGPANENQWGDDDDYWTFRNILYLQAQNPGFDSALRLDLNLFHEPPLYVPPDEFVPGGTGYTTLRHGNDFRVERLHGTAHLGDLHVTVGDSYVSFGRGIALSLIKLDDVGVDNALRGGRVEYRVPRKLRLVVVGGVVNALNSDPLTRQIQRDDPLDRIIGIRGEWELFDALSLGVHGVLMRPRFTDESQIEGSRLYVDQSPGIGVATGGASVELHAGGFHAYLEGDGQAHDNHRVPAGQEDVLDESGFAAFGELSYDLSPFNIKLEGLAYRRWLMEGGFRGSSSFINTVQPLAYNNMPTLEPVWITIKSFGNASGGRLGGDYYLNDTDTQISLSSSLLYYLGGLLPQGEWADKPPTLVVHPILGVRQGFGETGVQASVEGGLRYETTDEPENAAAAQASGIEPADSGHLWHAKADVAVPIEGPHSVEAKFEIRRHELLVTEDLEYWVTLTSLG